MSSGCVIGEPRYRMAGNTLCFLCHTLWSILHEIQYRNAKFSPRIPSTDPEACGAMYSMLCALVKNFVDRIPGRVRWGNDQRPHGDDATANLWTRQTMNPSEYQ